MYLDKFNMKIFLRNNYLKRVKKTVDKSWNEIKIINRNKHNVIKTQTFFLLFGINECKWKEGKKKLLNLVSL